MFRLSLLPAPPHLIKRWRVWCGVAVAGTGAASLSSVAGTLKETFPEGAVDETFVHMAVAVSFLFGLVLILSTNVLSLGLAQMSFATSIVFIGCSFSGIFPGPFQPIIKGALVLLVFVLVLLFWFDGVRDAWRMHSCSDLILRVSGLAVFLCGWVYAVATAWGVI